MVQLEKRICSIDYSPFRSISIDHGDVRFPSQEYTFSLFRNALRDRPPTLFIIIRSLKEWSGVVPKLFVHQLNISPSNLSDVEKSAHIPPIHVGPMHPPPNVIIKKILAAPISRRTTWASTTSTAWSTASCAQP